MNELNIKEGIIDQHLRPIKLGDKNTSLEITEMGSGCKINGNLEVTGEIKTCDDITCDDITCDVLTATTINNFASTDLTIDDSGDITLDAAGGDVNILQADLTIDTAKKIVFGDDEEHIYSSGTDLNLAAAHDINLNATNDIDIPVNVGLTFGNDGEKIEGDGTDLTINGNNIIIKPDSLGGNLSINAATTTTIELFNGTDGAPSIKLMSLIDTGDYFKISTTQHGATTIETVDDDGTSANLTLNIDGKVDINSSASDDIELDSGGGIYLDADNGECRLTDDSVTDDVFTPTHSADITTKKYVDDKVHDTSKFYYHFIRVGFVNSGISKMYMPLPGSEDMRELTSNFGASERLSFLCPFDGSLETVWARATGVPGSTIIGLHVQTSAIEVPSSTATQTVTEDMSVDDTSYEFDFAAVGTNTFSQGNIIMFSVDPTARMDDVHFMIVLKFDVTT